MSGGLWSKVLCLTLCLTAISRGDDSPGATPDPVEQCVDRAIVYLQTESAAWLNTRKCAACHHVPLPLWALSEAQQHGYAIDDKYLTDTFESLLGSRDALMSSRIFPNPDAPPDPRPQGRGLNMGLPLLAIAARSTPALTDAQRQSLQLVAEEIVQKQQPDGSWEFFAGLRRPPINESQTTDVAWIILSLGSLTDENSPASQQEALAKSRGWLAAADTSQLHQDLVLKLLLGIRSGAPREALQPSMDALLALQRDDGGWSQTIPEPVSDAFATGQSLYVLSLLGREAQQPEISRAMDFLVTSQAAEGHWPMASRSTPDGSPGSATLLTPIECAASSWAVLSLSRLPPRAK